MMRAFLSDLRLHSDVTDGHLLTKKTFAARKYSPALSPIVLTGGANLANNLSPCMVLSILVTALWNLIT
jgi:hypothetical protein